MEMTIVKYLALKSGGLNLDDFYTLTLIGEGKRLNQSEFEESLAKLENRGLIEGEILTGAGKIFLGKYDVEEKEAPLLLTTVWFKTLHQNLKDKMRELTGKQQKADKIVHKGRTQSYAFLPGETDLREFLLRFFRKYGKQDLFKVEKCLLAYIELCNNNNNWFPLMKYYIIHQDKGSPLASDLENFENREDIKAAAPSQRML